MIDSAPPPQKKTKQKNFQYLLALTTVKALPRMLKFDAERIISEKLQKENKHLHQKILTLQQEISILQDDKERKAVPKNAAFQSR